MDTPRVDRARIFMLSEQCCWGRMLGEAALQWGSRCASILRALLHAVRIDVAYQESQ